LLAKIGAAAFGTIVAPILVALVMKHLDPPAPPAAGPATDLKVEAVAALPAAAPASPPAVASNAPPVSSAPVPAVSSARVPAVPSAPAVSLPSAGARTGVSKPNLAAAGSTVAHKVKAKKNTAHDAAPARVTPGFTRIFNGRDLTGWTGGDNRWSVDTATHALVGYDPAGAKGALHTWIYTDRNYSNYRLRFDYRTGPGGDSGLSLRVGMRTGLDERYEVQLLGENDNVITTGTILGFRKDKGHPHTRPIEPVTLRPVGEWNTVEVELRGRHLKVEINGHAAQDMRFDPKPDSPKPGVKYLGETGRIALQCRAGRVEFRKIEIQELTHPAQ